MVRREFGLLKKSSDTLVPKQSYYFHLYEIKNRKGKIQPFKWTLAITQGHTLQGGRPELVIERTFS